MLTAFRLCEETAYAFGENFDRRWEERGEPGRTDRKSPAPCAPINTTPASYLFLPPWSDRELVERIMIGDRSARGQFVARFERLIHSVLHDLRLPIQEHEDLFQEVFVHLWEQDCGRLRQWQGRGRGRLSSFLRVLVMRLVYDALRSRPAPTLSLQDPEQSGTEAASSGLEDPSPGPEAIVITAEQRCAIQLVIETLSPRDAELIRRRYYHEQSYKEIASGMGITTDNVGVSLNRAEQRLQSRLCRRYPGLFENR